MSAGNRQETTSTVLSSSPSVDLKEGATGQISPADRVVVARLGRFVSAPSSDRSTVILSLRVALQLESKSNKRGPRYR